MAQPQIAIFGKTTCRQCLAVKEAVERAGGKARVLPIQMGPGQHITASIEQGAGQWDGVDFEEIASIYIRAVAPNTLPAIPPVMNMTSYSEWRTRYVREQEIQSFAYSFFSHLQALGKLVINPLSAYIHHNTKAQFYEALRAGGFDMPRTLTTNDPDRARAFVQQTGTAVVKPMIGVGSTRLVNEADLDRLEELVSCPVMLQEYIKGPTLRVHVVGDTCVLALRILGEGIDSRTGTKGFEYTTLPPEEEARIARANQFLGLHWAAWDVLAAEGGGRYAYLDCNPGAYVMWIGETYVRAVFDQLALYMMTFAQTRSVDAASARLQPYRE